MAIYKDSRYQYATISYQPKGNTNSGDVYPVLFYYFDNIGTIKYSEYVWKYGDRLDMVAYNTYGNTNDWWVIAEHNPEYNDPLNIPPGSVLRIPHA